jgi:pimeloyl-ACP methyl ester carboxylesterase
MKRMILVLVGVLLLAGFAIAAEDEPPEVAQHMVQLESRPGIFTRFILLRPQQPLGTIVLFPDGNGLLGISHVFNMPQLNTSADIPSDLINRLCNRHIAVVLIDAPSDHRSVLGVNGWQGPSIFRLSREHALDVAAVVDFLKQENRQPIWLAGIRMGAFSAVTAAIHLQQVVDGLVIAGGITRCPEQQILLQLCPAGLMGLPLHEITLPTLILSGGGTFPEPLLASALSHSSNIRYQTFPEFATFENWSGWNAAQAVLPGVSNAHVSREIAGFMQWHRMTHPILVCDTPPEDRIPLEIYLAGCNY